MVLGSPKCSMNISIQKNTSVFVVVNSMNEAPIIKGLLEVISPTNAIMFTSRNIKVSLLFPKFFNILELFVKRRRVSMEAIVYKIPMNPSFMIPVKKIELIYAEMEICKVNINDNAYILLILEI